MQEHSINQRQKRFEIIHYITDLIQKDQLPPHSPLPSQNALAIHFSVTRSLVRSAFDYLKGQNLVYAKKGKGFFVAPFQDVIVYPQIKDVGFSETFQDPNFHYQSLLLDWSLNPASEALRQNLQLKEGALVYQLTLLRSVHSEPLALCTSQIPQDKVPGFEKYLSLSTHFSINHILQSKYGYDHPLCHFVLAQAVMPQPEHIEALQINEGVPLLKQVSRFDIPEIGPIEYFTVYARGDRYKLTINF